MSQSCANSVVKYIVVSAIGIAVFCGSIFAEVIDAESKISEVVVFQDRALLSRRAELVLVQGAHTVNFPSLPGTIEESSMGVQGTGEAKVKLFGVKLVRTQLDVSQSPKVREIEEQIKNLNDRKQELQDEKTLLEEKEKFLISIKAASGKQLGKDLVTKQPSVADAETMLGFLEKIYERALLIELRRAGLQAEDQKPVKVYYDEYMIGDFTADILVNEKVFVEIKACKALCEENELQLINYLKSTIIEIGLLLNFGLKPEVKRKIFTNDRKPNLAKSGLLL